MLDIGKKGCDIDITIDVFTINRRWYFSLENEPLSAEGVGGGSVCKRCPERRLQSLQRAGGYGSLAKGSLRREHSARALTRLFHGAGVGLGAAQA